MGGPCMFSRTGSLREHNGMDRLPRLRVLVQGDRACIMAELAATARDLMPDAKLGDGARPEVT